MQEYICKKEQNVRAVGPITQATYDENIGCTVVSTTDGSCYYVDGNILDDIQTIKREETQNCNSKMGEET